MGKKKSDKEVEKEMIEFIKSKNKERILPSKKEVFDALHVAYPRFKEILHKLIKEKKVGFFLVRSRGSKYTHALFYRGSK